MDDLELKQSLSALAEQQKMLLEQLRANAQPRKDGWDKLQCLAPIISGFLIGGFGAFIGYTYNQQQIKLQEAEAIERFIPHLAGNERTKKAAILAMSSLTNTGLAAKMASLFASEGTVSALQSIAQSGDSKDRTVATEALAQALNNLAQHSLDDNNLYQAEEYLHKALSVKEKLDSPDQMQISASLDRLADLYIAQGKLALAEPLLRRSLAIKQKSQGNDNDETQRSIRRLAELLEQRGSTAEAEQLKRRSKASSDAALAQEPPQQDAATNEKPTADDGTESKEPVETPARDAGKTGATSAAEGGKSAGEETEASDGREIPAR